MQRHAPPFKLREFKIEVTYHCDLNCVHCSSDARPSNPLSMSLDDCVRVLEQAAELGAKEVALSGGEPLGWPYLASAVTVAVKRGFRTTIYTSGVTDGFVGKAEEMRRLGVDRFIFSVFGGTEATHERVTRVAGSFQATKNAILTACRIGLKPEIHFVPMSTNYRELKSVAALAKECGVSVISVLRLVPQGRATLLTGRVLNRVQNLELRRMIQDLRSPSFTIRLGSPYNFLMLNEKPGCWAAIDRLIVGPDLRIFPCDAFKRIDATELVGTEKWSSLKGDSLPDCWVKSPFLEAVRNYLTTEFEEPCLSCKLIDKCLSGCLAQKTIASQGLDKQPDPDCLGPHLLGGAR